MTRPSKSELEQEVPPRPGRGRKRLVAAAVGETTEAEPVAREADHPEGGEEADVIRVRRLHRRDLKRIWEFLKRVFRDVNQKTVELQRPRSRRSFEESYDDEGIEQLVFEHGRRLVGYAECTFEATGADNWVNWRWFDARDMRPLFVEELAVDPDYQGRGVGSFMLEQLRHSASLRGCTHLVLEVAENNEEALHFYRKRGFHKIDAAIFLAQKIERLPELLPPRPLKPAPHLPAREGKGATRSDGGDGAGAARSDGARGGARASGAKNGGAGTSTRPARGARAQKPARGNGTPRRPPRRA